MSDIDNIFTKFQEIFKKAETLNDSASFNFIKANLPILRNSSNPQHRFVAMRLENKLKDNENFQTFSSAQVQVKKEETVKEERKEHYERYEMKSNQQAANNKVQEDKKKAAEAERVKNEDLAYLKSINDQVAYNARINQIFLELELEKQQEIIQVQEKFKPENQQAVRNFILDKTQKEPEATQNLANIINKEEATFDSNSNKFEPLKVKVSTSDSSLTVTVDSRTSIKTMDNISGKTNAVFDQTLKVGNTEAAMAANSVATTVDTTKATKEAKTSLEAAERVFGKSVVDSENKDVQRKKIIEKQVNEAYPKLQDKIRRIEQSPISNEKKAKMIQQVQDKFSNEFAEQMKQQGYDMSNKETQDLVINDLSGINYQVNYDLEDEEKTQAEKNLRDFAKVLKLNEKKVEQELTETKEAAEQAIKDFNNVPIESQQATNQETQNFVINTLDAFEAVKKDPKALKASEALEVSKSEKEKNSNNVELTKKDEHTGLVSSNSLNETKEQVQQQIENDKKATEAMFDKKKDVAEVYHDMTTDKENEHKGDVIQKGISKNITEKAIENDGSIKESLKNSVDDSYAYQMAQEEAKRKDNNSSNELNRTAEEINKISNSNETSSPK